MSRRALLSGVVALAACHGAATPRDPVWGKQACAHCNMLVSDPLYAAQALNQRGDLVYFDDIGCLASYLAEARGASKSWVRDGGGHWLETSRARFRSGARTPMDFGFVVDGAGPLDFEMVAKRVAAKNGGET